MNLANQTSVVVFACLNGAALDEPALRRALGDDFAGTFVWHLSADDIARLDDAYRAARPSGPAATRLELNVLAGTASSSGREISLSDGEFAVLAAIALNRAVHSREEWCELLWPDREPESTQRLLRVYIHRIRTKFADNRIVETVGSGYRIGTAVRVDLHAVETLARTCASATAALDAHARAELGRAFEAIVERRYRRISGLEAYTELERRFTALAAETARLLVQDALLSGDVDGALRTAQRLAEAEPCDDVAAELLIRTHLLAGRSDAAARDFRAHCRALREELDLPPPPHLVQLLAAGAVASR